jgi:hypothetical protein
MSRTKSRGTVPCLKQKAFADRTKEVTPNRLTSKSAKAPARVTNKPRAGPGGHWASLVAGAYRTRPGSNSHAATSEPHTATARVSASSIRTTRSRSGFAMIFVGNELICDRCSTWVSLPSPHCDRLARSVPPSGAVCEGHHEGVFDKFGAHVIGQGPPYDATTGQVDDCGQVGPALPGGRN